MEQLKPLRELGQVLEHVQVRGGEGQMCHRVPDPLECLADRRTDAHGDDVSLGFHDIRGVRFLEQAEPAERDAPGGRPGVDAAQAVVGPCLVDAFLVPFALFLRDQQLGQGPVDPFHQGIRSHDSRCGGIDNDLVSEISILLDGDIVGTSDDQQWHPRDFFAEER